MRPDKLERNYEKLQLKEQSREQRKQARLNKLVYRYAGVSSEALVSRSDEARARASIFLTAFIISLSTCLISATGLAFSGLLEQVMAATLPLLTAALSIVASISTPVAVLTFFLAAKLYKEIEQLDDVLEWRFKRARR